MQLSANHKFCLEHSELILGLPFQGFETDPPCLSTVSSASEVFPRPKGKCKENSELEDGNGWLPPVGSGAA